MHWCETHFFRYSVCFSECGKRSLPVTLRFLNARQCEITTQQYVRHVRLLPARQAGLDIVKSGIQFIPFTARSPPSDQGVASHSCIRKAPGTSEAQYFLELLRCLA